MMLTDTSDEDADKASQTLAVDEDKPDQGMQLQEKIIEHEYVASDNLEVLLNFQIGNLVLSLKELRQIRPGFSFDLQKRLTDHPVCVMANGMLFATGELVCIGDFIGVRINRLSETSGNSATSMS